MDLPLSGGLSFAQNIDVPGRSRENNEAPVWFNFVGPRFFETMGIAIDGRDIRARDDATSPPVAVISQSLARRFFPDGHVLGRRVRTSATEVEVVGIAADVKYTGLRSAPTEMIYLPFLQGRAASNVGLITFAWRVERNVDETAAALRREVQAIAPDLLISNVSTLDERKDALLARERMIASLSLCFGTLAIFLGGVGLYGTLSYAVMRRTGELGVRLALGADALRLVRMVVRESLGPAIAGLVLGLPLAFAAGRVSERLLFDVRGSDPVTYVLAVAILVLSAACAAFVPARRAALVDPVVALRTE
jgi:ABC-type antimicrobial peptide transport system permease subunit